MRHQCAHGETTPKQRSETMKATLHTILAGLGLATLLAAAGASHAETHWQHNHPWRTQVNHRLANQNRRIDREYRRGEISRGQARDLHAEDRGMRAEERYDASRNGSHLTRYEHRQLNRQENQVSGQIGH
jgi:hypothetical protein